VAALLLDSYASLSPASRAMASLLRRLDPEITVLMIEHDMDMALELSEMVTVLHYGRVIADGPREQVKADPQVKEIYLGARGEGRPHLLRQEPRAAGRVAAGGGRRGAGHPGAQRDGANHLIRTIVGFTPARGARSLQDTEITRLPPFRMVELGMALVPQGRRVFPSLSVRENLEVARRGAGRWSLEQVYALFPRLRERAANRANKLSGGEQQMLAIGRALMSNPELLLMDEPTEGLAPLLVREVGRVIAELKRSGLSILLVEQNLALALSVADRVHVLSRGQIVHTGSPADLMTNDDVKTRYLGVA
jgi:ABC-type branched-subunit amino acid transport system ATPase component